MSTNPFSSGYDGTDDAARSFDAAVRLLSGRKAIVVDVGPVLTGVESYVAVTPGVDIGLLEQENLKDALERAQKGARLVGAIFGVESEGESPDERYDDQRRPGRDPRPRAPTIHEELKA